MRQRIRILALGVSLVVLGMMSNQLCHAQQLRLPSPGPAKDLPDLAKPAKELPAATPPKVHAVGPPPTAEPVPKQWQKEKRSQVVVQATVWSVYHSSKDLLEELQKRISKSNGSRSGNSKIISELRKRNRVSGKTKSANVNGSTVHGMKKEFVGSLSELERELLHSMISQIQTANGITSPTIITLDGQPASVFAGSEVPFTTGKDKSDKKVNFMSFGVKLDVLPKIKNDETVEIGYKFELKEKLDDEVARTLLNAQKNLQRLYAPVISKDGKVTGEKLVFDRPDQPQLLFEMSKTEGKSDVKKSNSLIVVASDSNSENGPKTSYLIFLTPTKLNEAQVGVSPKPAPAKRPTSQPFSSTPTPASPQPIASPQPATYPQPTTYPQPSASPQPLATVPPIYQAPKATQQPAKSARPVKATSPNMTVPNTAVPTDISSIPYYSHLAVNHPEKFAAIKAGKSVAITPRVNSKPFAIEFDLPKGFAIDAGDLLLEDNCLTIDRNFELLKFTIRGELDGRKVSFQTCLLNQSLEFCPAKVKLEIDLSESKIETILKQKHLSQLIWAPNVADLSQVSADRQLYLQAWDIPNHESVREKVEQSGLSSNAMMALYKATTKAIDEEYVVADSFPVGLIWKALASADNGQLQTRSMQIKNVYKSKPGQCRLMNLYGTISKSSQLHLIKNDCPVVFEETPRQSDTAEITLVLSAKDALAFDRAKQNGRVELLADKVRDEEVSKAGFAQPAKTDPYRIGYPPNGQATTNTPYEPQDTKNTEVMNEIKSMRDDVATLKSDVKRLIELLEKQKK